MARTNISVDQRVFDEFSYQAERQNKTLFAFANEWLSAVAKISAEGGNVTDMVRMWRTVSLLKQLDVITLPSDFIDELVAKHYENDKEGTLKLFRELGASLIGILKIAANDLEELTVLAKDFIAMLPIKQFKIINLNDGNSVEIDIVGAGRKIESTECSLEFVKSIIEGYGYTISKHEMNVGTIRMWASKRE